VVGGVEQQLRHWSTETISSQPAPGTLAGWRLYGDVVLQGDETLEGVLADRRPTLNHRFAFRGGLPLEAHRSYLSSGAPDVWLPPTTEVSLWLTLDGTRISTPGDKVRLADHLPEHETAPHLIGYGDAITRPISMIESVQLVPPPHDQPGHVLEPAEDVRPATNRMVPRIEDADGGTITVVGPHVRGASDRWSDTPVLLRRHAERAWLLGKEPGELLSIEKPAKPAWMEKQRLTGHLYEARASFTVQYSIERWSSGQLKARQRGSLEPGDVFIEGDVGTWAELLLNAELADGDLELWARYQGTAKLLEVEVGGR
jgi:hypothetical protein